MACVMKFSLPSKLLCLVLGINFRATKLMMFQSDGAGLAPA